ncbi:MAG: hypothetical protein GXP62_01330 [Oligoflexia bacterium]|nr:hypothetical protein [Oligoflexia bacterium]
MSGLPWFMPKPLQIDHRISGDQVVYLVSDIHLGDGSRSDGFVGKDREFIAFLSRARTHGAHLVVAGDFIDFHQAWSMSRVLRAHGRVIGELARYADDLGVTYIWGNHDADITLFKDLLRFDVCSSLEIDDQILVRHGYEYDPWIGPHLEASHVATQVHDLVERMLGTWIRLPLQNFYTRSNRLTFWTFHKLALLLQARADVAQRLGMVETARRSHVLLKYWAHNQLGDAAGMFENVRAALMTGTHRYLVTGHSHLPGQVDLSPDRTYVNTGSWTFNRATYAVWDGKRFTVRDWLTNREFGDRSYRALVDRSFRHLDYLDWWRAHYLGWFHFRCGVESWQPSLQVSSTSASANDRPAASD